MDIAGSTDDSRSGYMGWAPVIPLEVPNVDSTSTSSVGEVNMSMLKNHHDFLSSHESQQTHPHDSSLSSMLKINVLLVRIALGQFGVPSIIIYALLKGFLQTPLFINQPE